MKLDISDDLIKGLKKIIGKEVSDHYLAGYIEGILKTYLGENIK